MRLTLFFLFITFCSVAQNFTGKVLEQKSNDPLAGVNIYLNKTKEGGTTNKKGVYKLKFRSNINDRDTLLFSHIGYKTYKITIAELRKKEFLVLLTVDNKNIKEVTVAKNKQLRNTLRYEKIASMKNGIHSFGALLDKTKIYILGGDESAFADNATQQFKRLSDINPGLSLLGLISKLTPEFRYYNFSNKLQIFDIETSTLEESELKFRKKAFHNIIMYNNKIYSLGGKQISRNGKFEYLDNKIEVFDLSDNSITIDHTNPHQAVNFACALANNSIIVAGGSVKNSQKGLKQFTKKVHLYQLDTGLWYELADMPTAKETKGIVVKNKFYLFGGNNQKPVDDVEVLNLLTEKWEKIGELFSKMNRPALTNNGKVIYIFEDGKINTYNTDTKILKEYLINLALNSAEIFYTDKKLYIIGGFWEDEESKSPSKKIYRIDIKEFENTSINNSKTL